MQNGSEKICRSGGPGEQAALQFLVEKGWTIKEKNWRYRRAEIDIIAVDREWLVFVEVKSRTQSVNPPEIAVSARQEARLADAAGEYMMQTHWDGPYRFDIITVNIQHAHRLDVVHFEDAFFPGHH